MTRRRLDDSELDDLPVYTGSRRRRAKKRAKKKREKRE